MSVNRLSLPGQPVRLVDLGPARGRMAGTSFYLIGDVTLVPNRALDRKQPDKTGRPIVRAPYSGPRCGALMPILGVSCFRRPHDDRDHRSEAAVRKDAAR